MDTATAQPIAAESPASRWTGRAQIRGSSLLLLGRLPSKGLNFLTQVLVVHLLTRGDYGAFAWALSIVALSKTVITFGLHRSITRFIPIYQERGETGKLVGTGLFVTGAIGLLSALVIGSLYGLQGVIGGSLLNDPRGLSILLVLIFLAPLQAIDEVVIGLFAVFGAAKQIFFRQHIVGPGLKLGAVLLVWVSGGGVYGVAAAFLAASVLGVAIYAGQLWRLLEREGICGGTGWRVAEIPGREILAFTIPLLSTDLLYIAINTMDAVMLEAFRGVADVAALRAVQPAALLNHIVMNSFGVLFTPVAARLFARGDREGINRHYWRTAVWVSLLSFPIFMLTFSCAEPLTLLLYGARYEQSALILALLSVGYFFNASLGFNGVTLKVYGKLRYIVLINVAAAVLNIAANLILIPRYGALGAAAGTCGTLIVHNIFKQIGLKLGTGINLLDRRFLRAYGVVIAAAVALLAPQFVWSFSPYFVLPVSLLVSLLVIRLNRGLLEIETTFPELMKLPLLGRFLRA